LAIVVKEAKKFVSTLINLLEIILL